MIDKIFTLVDKYWLYLWPYFLLPLGVIFVVDYIVALSWFIKAGCMIIIIVSIVSILLGFIFGILDFGPGEKKYESFLNTNLAKRLPLYEAGYKLGLWAIRDIND